MSEASAILTAMYEGNTDALAALLAARPELDVFEAAAVEAVSGDGWTALHLAAYFGQGEAVERLLAAGADPRVPSRNRLANTPLHAALAGRANVRIITALLARGADVETPASGGYRPLHLAAARGDVGIIDMLLIRGARVGARAEDGRTPLAIAEERGHTAAARRLRGEMP